MDSSQVSQNCLPSASVPEVETTRYAKLPKLLKVLFLAASATGIVLAVIYIFGFSISGWYPLDAEYYYLLISLFSSSVFLVLPARKKYARVPWYDLAVAAATFGIAIYFFLNAYAIRTIGWVPTTTLNLILAIILFLSVIEGGRRMGGYIFVAVVLLFAVYPLFASSMPGILYGKGYPYTWVFPSHVFTSEGLIGLPLKVMGNIVLGFLLFSATLVATGAGRFFLNLAMGLLGRYRGGPAKVSVLSSGFFGMLSGSIFSNIIGTGCVTIPAMKRMGFRPDFAGAVEACASTGGVLMPPVMGAVAFVMAAFLGIDYGLIVVAAAIPAILYYYGLMMQVDAHAARTGLRGLNREEIPPLRKTLKEGWTYVAVLLFLLWALLYMKWEMRAPYLATGLLILLSFARRETMMTPKRMVESLVQAATLITQSFAIILPIGFIVSGMYMTGFSLSFTNSLVTIGGGNIFLVLLLGVIACYIMGMFGLITPAYIFLAITMAPAVIRMGQLNVLAVHLFIMYYSMLASFTPPVAGGAFLAANIAGANPMKTSVTAMRLGIVIYFVPFFFVFNPSLILQGTILETIYLFAFCLVGILLIAGGVEGYLVKLGALNIWQRPLFVIAGFLIAFPNWETTLVGAILAFVLVGIILMRRQRQKVASVIEG